MGQNDKNQNDGSIAASTGGAKLGRLAAIGLLVLSGVFFVYALSTEDPAPQNNASSASPVTQSTQKKDPGQTHRYRYFEDPKEARPLPVTLPPSRFQNPGIASTYRIAKEIPEVLAQQPCLCGCGDNASEDHRSLLDCYVNEHASTCMVCMKEAVLASKMTSEGKSAKEIREAILRHDFTQVSIGN